MLTQSPHIPYIDRPRGVCQPFLSFQEKFPILTPAQHKGDVYLKIDGI